MSVNLKATDLIDGSGWISDESDFYGDDATLAKLEQKAATLVKRKYEAAHANTVSKRKALRLMEEQARLQPPSAESVGDFLRSRPRSQAMHQCHVSAKPVSKEQALHIADDKMEVDVPEDTMILQDPAAWQRDETIADFLRRLPIAEPSTAHIGPWLWVHNRGAPSSPKEQAVERDLSAFMRGSEPLFQAFRNQKSQLEANDPGKAAATITRRMRPYKEQLEDELLALAVKTGVTCGKWMFFPAPFDLPRTWRLVAQATAEGKLGLGSKVATHDASATKPERVICVYTYDFTDQDDVRRVLDELVSLDLCARDSPRGIYYKCDAYTHLDLMSDNPYNIRASLYSSKDLLNNQTKTENEGPIARLRKRGKKIDSL